MKTSEGLHPKCFANSAAHCRAAFMPASPVTALALPAFTRTAREVLPETFRCSTGDENRSSWESVLCEDHCRGGRAIGIEKSEVEAALPDAGGSCRNLKAFRGREIRHYYLG